MPRILELKKLVAMANAKPPKAIAERNADLVRRNICISCFNELPIDPGTGKREQMTRGQCKTCANDFYHQWSTDDEPDEFEAGLIREGSVLPPYEQGRIRSKSRFRRAV
jgi:hypothetical protein